MTFEVRSDGYADEIPGTESDESDEKPLAEIIAALPNPATGLSDPTSKEQYR